ncbi:hypothetical protein QE450_002633 [Paenibacillus sp. SORGH_AS306]|uniref:hypothetical protein n=1 Tax=unclassified Paenibacillus TaxID=185978 RepID=UPI002786D117|nr:MULTISPECIES: hypothetical protein [unclassified Paenibacillus]MDQ1235135.1 hypothetical protein [Paenibacillus sp. SORGH_AS_0306]MDR6112182.1 hypothetical protein [Paenibacillus sp. SORGH_AS_0338]
MEKVKFFSSNDLSSGLNLQKSAVVLNEYNKVTKEINNINDVIEIYNIKQFFDNGLYIVTWTPEDIEKFKKIISTIFSLVAKYIQSINDQNIDHIYQEVVFYYKLDFWKLMDKFKAYKNISGNIVESLLVDSKIRLIELLKYKNITEYYGIELKKYMLSDNSTAEILLDKYEIKHFRKEEEIYLPKELSSQDKQNIISKYIDSDEPNLNYLRLIKNVQSNKDKLEISPEILLKAKRKAGEQENRLFENSSGMEIETAVIFSKHEEIEVSVSNEGFKTEATYSSKWIEDNLDQATLLNNFIYMFEFVDSQMRCAFVNKASEMGVFERFLSTTSQTGYVKGFAFEHKNIFALLQMNGYYNQLFSNGIRLEEVIEWFFVDYLSAEFDAFGFRVFMPSTNSTFLEKCTAVMPALESILKQFTLYVETKQIDFELLEIRSEHLIYKNIPSLIEKKYAYGIGNEFEQVTFLLFSDQSGLGYIDDTRETYNNFFELLRNEQLKISDFPDFNIPNIQWMIDRDYLTVENDGVLVFSNILLIKVLHDLYKNEVIAYWSFPFAGKAVIDQLKIRQLIEFESTLFSRPEYHYINYLLNRSQFSNGLDLRNKYSHMQPNAMNEDKTHAHNYFIFLNLFILAVIKINDEFCNKVISEN